MIRERCLRGLKERAKSGKLVGGNRVHLYGYDYREGEGIRCINQHAEVVRDIFQWCAEGETVHGIAYRLTELGIPTPTGKSRWNPSTVGKILRNPAYIGKPTAYHDIEIIGSTPPIISEELFNQVQSRLKSNQRKASRNTKAEFLLRGHIKCSRDHRMYYGAQWHGVRYYYCSGRLRVLTSHKCDNKTYQVDILDDIVWAQVEELLKRPDIILAELERRNREADQRDLTQELDDVEKRLVDLARQQEDLLRWALKGFPEQTIVRENSKINQYRENLKTRQSELSKRITDFKQNELDLAGIKHFCRLASENLANFTSADKRFALEALQLEVLIDGDQISISGAVPACNIASTQLKLGHRV